MEVVGRLVVEESLSLFIGVVYGQSVLRICVRFISVGCAKWGMRLVGIFSFFGAVRFHLYAFMQILIGGEYDSDRSTGHVGYTMSVEVIMSAETLFFTFNRAVMLSMSC